MAVAVAESAIVSRVSATVALTRTAAVIDAVTAPIVALTVDDDRLAGDKRFAGDAAEARLTAGGV